MGNITVKSWLDDNLQTIVPAIEEGKSIFYNIRNFVTFQLSTSIAALSLIAISTILGLPSPLNAMQVLWINILMDGPPAQSLGLEPSDPDLTKGKPRPRGEKLLNKGIIKRILINATLILCGTFWVLRREYLGACHLNYGYIICEFRRRKAVRPRENNDIHLLCFL